MPRQIVSARITTPAPGLLVPCSLTRPVSRSDSPSISSGDDAGLDLTTATR